MSALWYCSIDYHDEAPRTLPLVEGFCIGLAIGLATILVIAL
jgi:hypothetical protein